MGALTHESLVEYLLEEAFEVAETIETGADEAELRGELGDVLLQVVLHARLAEERGSFGFDDVVQGLTAKMIRRNPHVFRPDGSLQDTFPASVEEIVRNWDSIKRAEKPERGDPFEGIPQGLPALARAQKSLDRAARAGLAVAPGFRPGLAVPAGPVVERVGPVVRLVEPMDSETSSAISCSSSSPLPAAGGSTPNAPSVGQSGGTRTATALLTLTCPGRDHDVRVLDRFP